MHTTIKRTSLVAAVLGLLLALVPACAEDTYVFDEVDIGDDEAGRTPRERSNSQFLRAVYADLIGRTPEAYDFEILFDGTPAGSFPLNEQDVLIAALDGVGDTAPMRSVIITGLLNSAEANIPAKGDVDDAADWITEQFRFFLGRDPGVYELQTFVKEWGDSSDVNPKTVIRALLESREYQSY